MPGSLAASAPCQCKVARFRVDLLVMKLRRARQRKAELRLVEDKSAFSLRLTPEAGRSTCSQLESLQHSFALEDLDVTPPRGWSSPFF
jgi:hypothetical protein